MVERQHVQRNSSTSHAPTGGGGGGGPRSGGYLDEISCRVRKKGPRGGGEQKSPLCVAIEKGERGNKKEEELAFSTSGGRMDEVWGIGEKARLKQREGNWGPRPEAYPKREYFSAVLAQQSGEIRQ